MTTRAHWHDIQGSRSGGNGVCQERVGGAGVSGARGGGVWGANRRSQKHSAAPAHSSGSDILPPATFNISRHEHEIVFQRKLRTCRQLKRNERKRNKFKKAFRKETEICYHSSVAMGVLIKMSSSNCKQTSGYAVRVQHPQPPSHPCPPPSCSLSLSEHAQMEEGGV